MITFVLKPGFKLLILLFLVGLISEQCYSPKQTTDLKVNKYGESFVKENLNVREGPSVDTKIIETLTKGDKVYVLDESSHWYKIDTRKFIEVTLNGKRVHEDISMEGYVNSEYLTAKQVY